MGNLICDFIPDKEYPKTIGRKHTREYGLWTNMLQRCKESYWDKKPTYTGTTCSENFKSYPYFYKWCNEQIGFGNTNEKGRSWCLDKDLLLKDNKFYSENTCVFIPSMVNNLIVKRNNLRGDYPIGVYLNKRSCRFVARCNIDKIIQKHIGAYGTPQEAFEAYKSYKEAYIKQVAEKYKDQLDPRAYQALLNYQVEVTD
jgi:hypothetical protein